MAGQIQNHLVYLQDLQETLDSLARRASENIGPKGEEVSKRTGNYKVRINSLTVPFQTEISLASRRISIHHRQSIEIPVPCANSKCHSNDNFRFIGMANENEGAVRRRTRLGLEVKKPRLLPISQITLVITEFLEEITLKRDSEFKLALF